MREIVKLFGISCLSALFFHSLYDGSLFCVAMAIGYCLHFVFPLDPAVSAPSIEAGRSQPKARENAQIDTAFSDETSSCTTPKYDQSNASQFRVKNLIDGTLVSLNSSEPVHFETESIRGKYLFLMQPMAMESIHAHMFNGKRRRIWIQVQVQFKKAPKGIVYMGAELPQMPVLGLISRAVASGVFGLIKTVMRSVHTTLGDADQLPLIVFPLYQTADQFIATPVGQTPPELGQVSFG